MKEHSKPSTRMAFLNAGKKMIIVIGFIVPLLAEWIFQCYKIYFLDFLTKSTYLSYKI